MLVRVPRSSPFRPAKSDCPLPPSPASNRIASPAALPVHHQITVLADLRSTIDLPTLRKLKAEFLREAGDDGVLDPKEFTSSFAKVSAVPFLRCRPGQQALMA